MKFVNDCKLRTKKGIIEIGAQNKFQVARKNTS